MIHFWAEETPMLKKLPLIQAEWRSLLFLNYRVDTAVLLPYLPAGTEPDLWEGEPLVSIVGLQFRDTRAVGIPVPFHQRFAQVNLRFYVRTTGEEPARRGVVFIKEMIPGFWMARAARLMGENYHVVPTGFTIENANGQNPPSGLVEYTWKLGRPGGRRRVNRLGALVSGAAEFPRPGSLEEFVTARHWSFTPRSETSTTVMRSEHPLWRVSPVAQPYLLCDVKATYGEPFVPYLHHRPHSALLAEGGPVTLRLGYPDAARGAARGAVVEGSNSL